MKASTSKSRVRIAGLVAVLFSQCVVAQTYPTKPIRLFAANAGGAVDIAARTVIAPAIAEGLSQKAVVENRPGGIVSQVVARAAPDGYSLLVHGSIVWLQQFMSDTQQWDALKDFAPITMAVVIPNVLVVPPNLPVNSVKELIALAKSKPGQLNYGSGAPGTITHLAGELFKAKTGVDIVRIPYSGTGPGLVGMLAGEIQMMFPAASSGMPQVRAGKLKALAVATLQPSKLAPGLPTMASQGVPGFDSGASTAVFAPAKTPDPIIRVLHGAISSYIKRPEVVEKLLQQGVDAIGSTPEELTERMKADMVTWGKVLKDAGITAE